MLVCASLHNFAHETAGAACTRHSLHPPFAAGDKRRNSGASRREDAWSWLASYSLMARMALMIGKQRISQQLRLLRRDRVADGDGAAGDHLGIDPAFVVAEPAHQSGRDVEV